MAIVPTESTRTAESSVISLPRYAQRIQYPECQFFGVKNAPDVLNSECREIWTKEQRDDIKFYLGEAQREIENVLCYFVQPRWVVGLLQDTTDERLVDNQDLSGIGRQIARWGMILEGGVQAFDDVSLGEAVSHAADPAVVGPFAAGTVTSIDEVRVYHPGTDVEIHPSSIDLSGGNLTINIPRCRMVKSSLADNPPTGLEYTDTTNFEATVDVKREYNDPSKNAVLVKPHQCSSSCSSQGCSENTQTACIYVRDQRTGIIDVRPASYSGGSWTAQGLECCIPSLVRLNYRAGLLQITDQLEDAIIRLAHSKMPNEPCGCDVTQRLWRRDRNIPDQITIERASNPFGLNDGAWIAYKFTKANALVRMGVI